MWYNSTSSTPTNPIGSMKTIRTRTSCIDSAVMLCDFSAHNAFVAKHVNSKPRQRPIDRHMKPSLHIAA